MKAGKEQWIQEVLDAVKNRTDATGNPWLHTRVLARIDAARPAAAARLSPKWILAATAGFCMLVMVNILGLSRHGKARVPGHTDAVGQLVQEYGMNEQFY